MKKFILSVAVLATITLSALAADDSKTVKDDSKNVPVTVLNQFNSEFSGAKNVTWTVSDSAPKADFVVDGVSKTAFYNISGDFVGVTQEATINDLPAYGVKQISKLYAGYNTGQVIKFVAEDPEMPNFTNSPLTAPTTTNYYVSLTKGNKEILVQVSVDGTVSYFKKVK
ncbi:hypothetical protein [Mucilaginibacter myungsuensis]|uniref:PepSY-like beta-lactamase-inhibitor n=1 Tax=Mucilaginibacter myungsuensis TaxID=649104 RepID=A0A929KUX0_9SPHI|nr:hypothetical protein [Mucilaginibacter myungsuensis]MBE9660353.1 hypothetical protein [Mucilaginibacter myungsuensis]MDN3600395.1 hypothetical protein [Mucilaginibacter myungsuensis]